MRTLIVNLITLTLGWWGVPWGVLLTPLILWGNLRGGTEVFKKIARTWDRPFVPLTAAGRRSRVAP